MLVRGLALLCKPTAMALIMFTIWLYYICAIKGHCHFPHKSVFLLSIACRLQYVYSTSVVSETMSQSMTIYSLHCLCATIDKINKKQINIISNFLCLVISRDNGHNSQRNTSFGLSSLYTDRQSAFPKIAIWNICVSCQMLKCLLFQVFFILFYGAKYVL